MSTLPFCVTPQFLEDLGLNLYTSLDKVLVEFIANAHDADAKNVVIEMDVPGIDGARRNLKNDWDAALQRSQQDGTDAPPLLESQALPDQWKIIIKDDGHGMSKADLESKYLQVSRRKREDDGTVSPGGRVFMGRKGLGKLAGFGVAQKIIVTSLKRGEPSATRIILDYAEIKGFPTMNDVRVPCEILPDKGGIEGAHGTVIELSRLAYSGLRGTQHTALRHAVECFWMIDAGDFAIFHGVHQVRPAERTYEWSYPEEEGRENSDLIYKSISLGGKDYGIRYRIRFTPSKGQLRSHEQGIRVFAHKRLAATPSLFEVASGSTGYKYTSYMDGVLVADFIDEQPADYIGTNRQGIRWETPLLSELHQFMHDEIKESLKQYYATKESTITAKVQGDLFTKDTIKLAKLPPHREKLAYSIAVTLAKGDPDEIESGFYKKSLPVIVHGLSRGDVLRAISELAKEDTPNLAEVLREISELTKQEFGDFLSIVQGRLDGIEALRKIYIDQDFKGADNEKELQLLFENNPWLIDPTFFQFMSADESQNSFNDRLSRQLVIGKYGDVDVSGEEEVSKYGLNKRPDLTFVLANNALAKIVIVELKSPNTPLHIDHLTQLKNYLRRTEDFLAANDPKRKHVYEVKGLLIGSRAPEEDFQREKVRQLQYEEEKRPEQADWTVLSISEVLERTALAHREMISAHERAKTASAS